MPSHLPPLFRTVGALAVFLPLMTGCSLPVMVLGHFESPVVTVGASRVESISPRTLVVQLALTVRNPNAVGLPTRAVTYRLRLNGQVLANGTSASRVTVPAHASSTVDVRIQVPFAALSAAAPDALMLGEIPYDLDGTLLVGSFLVTREVPFAVASVFCISPPLELASWLWLPWPQETGRRTLAGRA